MSSPSSQTRVGLGNSPLVKMNSLSCPFGAPDSHVKRKDSLTVFAQTLDCKRVAANSTRAKRLIVNADILETMSQSRGLKIMCLRQTIGEIPTGTPFLYRKPEQSWQDTSSTRNLRTEIVPKEAGIMPKRQKRRGSQEKILAGGTLSSTSGCTNERSRCLSRLLLLPAC